MSCPDELMISQWKCCW